MVQNVIPEEVLKAMATVLDPESANKVQALLQDAGVRLIDGAPSHEEVKDLLPTLRARLANTVHTGKRIFGLEQLIGNLAQMDPRTSVLGYGFVSPKAAANLYFLDEAGGAVGAAIVDR